MTDTPIIYPDGRLIVRDRLRALLANRTEDYAVGVTVSTREFPVDDSAPLPVPYIQVKSDGSIRDSSLDGRMTIRLLCFGDDDGHTAALALLAESLILADHAGGLRGCTSQQSVFPTYDPDSGRPMAFLTFTARLRPSNLI
jgi:hypothetical protein